MGFNSAFKGLSCNVYTELCPESEEISVGDTAVLSYIPVKKVTVTSYPYLPAHRVKFLRSVYCTDQNLEFHCEHGCSSVVFVLCVVSCR